MGVRSLQTFQQKSVPHGYYKVNILEEIHQYKRFDPQPTIVIDVLAFMNIHSRNKLMMLFGGDRFSVLANMYHKIFRRLKAAGAQLVFFLDGPHQAYKDAVWQERQNVKYDNCCAILELMKSRIPAKTLVEMAGDQIPNSHVFVTEFKNICQQYGKMYVSFLNECDLEIVEFAHRVKALAVITDDSDFLIYSGGFHYWSAKSFNEKTLTTMEYDRRAFRKFLLLTEDQLKILATFGGNDFVPFSETQKFLVSFGKAYEKFPKLAEFIRRFFNGPLNDDTVCEMSLKIFGTSAPEKLQQVQKSLQSYDIASIRCKNVTDELLIYAMDNGYQFLYQILNGVPFELLMYFVDLRIDTPFDDVVSSLLRKMCGILMQHKNDGSLKQKIYKKQSHEETYVLTTLDPEYTAETLPSLLELYRAAEMQSDAFMDLKLSLLAWMVGVDRSVVDATPPQYLISLLTLVYLHQKEQLTTFQADLILIIVHESITGRIPNHLPLPNFCNETLVKKSFLYVKMWYWVACAVLAVGLPNFPKNIHWDGLYFHRLALEPSSKIAKRLEAVAHLRVYAATK